MNLLNGTRCYLAGNLQCSEDSVSWREKYTKFLQELGVKVLSPVKEVFIDDKIEDVGSTSNRLEKMKNGDFDSVSGEMKKIIRRDLRMIDISDFVIFKLEPNKPTYGTIHEFVISSQQRKALFCVVNSINEFPLWLSGLVSRDCIFEKDEYLFTQLTLLDSGHLKMNKKYWRILKEEFS